MKLGHRGLFAAFVIALVASVSAFGITDAELRPYQGKIIKSITIIRKNVFDDEMIHNSHFYYRWANSVHIKTRESVVRREVLFHVGDTLDVVKVIETERNLRLMGFIGEVVTSPKLNGHDGVDLTITTTDLWTTKIASSLQAAGGKYSVGIDATEANILGQGKYAELSGLVGNDQNGYQAFVSDPRFFASRYSIQANYSHFTFNKNYLLHIERPQYSLIVPYALKLDLSNLRGINRLFFKNKEYFRFKQENQFYNFEWLYSFGLAIKLSLTGGYTYNRNKFFREADQDSLLDREIPANETKSYPSLGVRGDIIKYAVERYLDKAGTPEDLTLGATIRFKAGHSTQSFGANFIGSSYAALVRFLVNPTPTLYFGGIDRIDWWNHDGRNERIMHISEMAIYYKTASTQVLTFHALTDFAWRQRNLYQIILGGGNGLRGFPLYEFSGTRLAVGNIEYRFYLPVEILTVRLGGAVFFDAGNVWQEDQKIHPTDLNSDIGFGLRFGLSKSSIARVLRFDLARSLSNNQFFVSLGSGNSYSLEFPTDIQ